MAKSETLRVGVQKLTWQGTHVMVEVAPKHEESGAPVVPWCVAQSDSWHSEEEM